MDEVWVWQLGCGGGDLAGKGAGADAFRKRSGGGERGTEEVSPYLGAEPPQVVWVRSRDSSSEDGAAEMLRLVNMRRVLRNVKVAGISARVGFGRIFRFLSSVNTRKPCFGWRPCSHQNRRQGNMGPKSLAHRIARPRWREVLLSPKSQKITHQWPEIPRLGIALPSGECWRSDGIKSGPVGG